MSDAFYGENLPPELPRLPTQEEIFDSFNARLSGLAEEAAEIVAALKATVEQHPEIRLGDEDTYAIFGQNIRIAQALSKTADERRMENKRPYTEIGGFIDQWFKLRIQAQIEQPLAAARKIQDVYTRAKLVENRRLAQQAADEAKRKADELAVKAAAALAAAPNSGTTAEHLAMAEHAAEVAAKAAAHASAPAAEHTRIRGSFGGVVSSARTQWAWREIDANKVPRKFMEISTTKVNAFLAECGRDPQTRKPLGEIPGIEVYEKITTGNR